MNIITIILKKIKSKSNKRKINIIDPIIKYLPQFDIKCEKDNICDLIKIDDLKNEEFRRGFENTAMAIRVTVEHRETIYKCQKCNKFYKITFGS